MNATDTLGFCSFVEGGIRYYGCRGCGKDYEDFYNWVYSTSYKCTSEDFPWDYFVFVDPKDEQEFLERYSHLMDYRIDPTT